MYRKLGVVQVEDDPSRSWPVQFIQFVNMTSDSRQFITRADMYEVSRIDNRHLLRLYEGKLTHQYDHRYSTFGGVSEPDTIAGNPRDVTDAEHKDPTFVVEPRYWVPRDFCETALNCPTWKHQWFGSFHSITNPNNDRTAIFCIVPESGVGNSSPVIVGHLSPALLSAFHAAGNSFVFDFVSRRRIGSRNFNFFILKQLPMPSPDIMKRPHDFLGASLAEWLLPRFLELTYTAYDLEPFAKDCGYDGPPFCWNEARRFLIRCEIDSTFFHVYGVEREDAEYIMDTFSLVRRRDEEKHGEYRTKCTILKVYDQMAKCIRNRCPYQTLLDPPPADPRVTHPRNT
jgi:hypothetical protein